MAKSFAKAGLGPELAITVLRQDVWVVVLILSCSTLVRLEAYYEIELLAQLVGEFHNL